MINDTIAIGVYEKDDPNARLICAKTADELITISDITASFVVGRIGKDVIGVSARSLGNYDIEKILIKLGGGGDTFSGAAKFEGSTVNKVAQELKALIKEEGE